MSNFALYHTSGTTDLQKLQDEALKRQNGDRWTKPQGGTLHMHPKITTHASLPGRTIEVECNPRCRKYEIEAPKP